MTKNEFFADYFKGLIEDISIKLDQFKGQNENQFNIGFDEDGITRDEIQCDMSYMLEQWEQCVTLGKTEGYPVVEIWDEEKNKS